MNFKFRLIIPIAAVIILAVYTSCTTVQPAVWPAVKKEMRPWTRWWWMGNAVNENDISALLDTYHKAGFGGVEIAPIYGVKGYEGRYLQYLSPQWMTMLRHSVSTASALDMGVDLTNGTGWPFGGPQITAPYAASKLIIQKYAVKAGNTLTEKIRVKEPKQEAASLQFITAYSDKGEVIQLADRLRPDGTLNWKAGSSNWQLYAVFNGKTRQMVKRASPGGEGFTLDHFSKDGLNRYLSRFDSAFNKVSPGIRAFYNDSYEVYGADWSGKFPALFQKNRGYDFRSYIHVFACDTISPEAARLKSDYRETMSEMLLENFTRPWTEWSRSYHAATRNQAHGSPGNLLDLYAAVDIPECETFGSSYFPIPGLRRDSADIRNVDPDPIMLKFASSAAHVTGHHLASCETFTWLTEHFKTSLSQCKPEVEQVFLSGVNHVFFHGTTYSPPGAAWPGWLFYASVDFVPSNSIWSHLPALTNYITRVQSVLQSGKPDNELLIYWPVYDIWNRAEGRDMPLKVHDIDRWLHPTPFYKNVTTLQKSGYSLDFISDKLLKNAVTAEGKIITSPRADGYKVLIIPAAHFMQPETMQKVLLLAERGATILLQSLPEDVPGLGRLEERREELRKLLAAFKFSGNSSDVKIMKTGSGRIILSEDVQKALEYTGLRGEPMTASGLKFIRRTCDENTTWYYIVNHTPARVSGNIPLNVRASSVVILDPQSGDTGLASARPEGERVNVRLEMEPGEALILKTATKAVTGLRPWKYKGNTLTPVEVKGTWQLRFLEGGPALPSSRSLAAPTLWTSFSDSTANNFSGLAEYSVDFVMPAVKASEYLLETANLYGSAHVWVNGSDAGYMWSIPNSLRIGKFIHPGKNSLRIQVANLMANRIRYMDRSGIRWKIFGDINIANINYKMLDASEWKIQPSGLGGPVKIVPYQE